MPDKEGFVKNRTVIIIVISVCLLAVIIAVVLIVIFSKRRKPEAGSSAYGQLHQPDRNIARNANRMDAGNDRSTEILRRPESNEQEGTVLLWNNGAPPSYQMTLTDIHATAHSYQAPLRGTVVIGRKQGMCNLIIDYDMSVSGRHCAIREHDGKFYISDLQSSNGTYVNDLRISSDTEITSGSVIRMGKLEFRFDVR